MSLNVQNLENCRANNELQKMNSKIILPGKGKRGQFKRPSLSCGACADVCKHIKEWCHQQLVRIDLVKVVPVNTT